MTSGVTMAGSGILWVDNLFNSCVLFLVQIASLLGITYEELNVYLFCIAWPTITVYLMLRIMYLKWKVKWLKT
jgi:uncharacterized membrane protein